MKKKLESIPFSPLPVPVEPVVVTSPVVLQVYGRRHAGDDAHVIGSLEGLTALRDGLTAFLNRCASDPKAVGRVENFQNPDGATYSLCIRVGTSNIAELDWKALKPEYLVPSEDTTNTSP